MTAFDCLRAIAGGGVFHLVASGLNPASPSSRRGYLSLFCSLFDCLYAVKSSLICSTSQGLGLVRILQSHGGGSGKV